MNLNQLFEKPLFRTKITSANVKPKEALLGYFLGPFGAFISNAVFGAYLNRYYIRCTGVDGYKEIWSVFRSASHGFRSVRDYG